MGRTLGVVGTLVWDRILDRDGRAEPVEEWGGIGYALAALRAGLPDDWRILPIVKVGRDLSEEAFRFLKEIPGIDESAIILSSEPNNRVELRYQTEARRCERLTGGVPPWTWPELGPVVDLCDALYVNFISGFEMELGTARALRAGYEGPIYADLHSLFLHMNPRGLRVPHSLAHWGEWFRCFDGVQMNEDEFELLGHATEDPWLLTAGVVGDDLKLITVTLGPAGAAYVTAPGFEPDPAAWRVRRALSAPGPARSGRVALQGPPLTGDPTGCGDVWGATLFARLLSGDALDVAMAGANSRAARNVEHRGARGLFRHLVGRLSHVEES
jgi:sugar/nucleoside kinase (ribokinase family)